MTDPLIVSLVAVTIWLFGVIVGIWIADSVLAAFETFFDVFRR